MCCSSLTTSSGSPRCVLFLTGGNRYEQIVQLGQLIPFSQLTLWYNVQANSEVSALLGRIPSAVGYQPTLATDLGGLQERITTTKKGSITSVQVRPCCQSPSDH